jgi:26S proteasome regulatory subunit T3
MLGVHEKPDVTYGDVGGLDMQKQEIREAVELPLTHFDLYKQIGEPTGFFCALRILNGL